MKLQNSIGIIFIVTFILSQQTVAITAVNRPEKVPFKQEYLSRLKLPPGFEINVFADNLGKPRMLAARDDGGVYVTRPSTQDVVLLQDTNGDGRADQNKTVAQNIKLVHGIAIHKNKLYLCGEKELYSGNLDGTNLKRLISDLPDGGQHPNRTIQFGPDGMLYISVGSTCNACKETNPEHATILRSDGNSAKRIVVMKGLRNTIGFGWHPETKQMWGMDHGSDERGDDLPPEELNQLQPGDFGWPYCFDKKQVDPLIKPAMDALKWLDQYADIDGDGFYEYQTHSIQGVKNQGWKDSGDAIVYEDGSQVNPPIATCEEQAFAFLAKLHLSEVLWWFDERELARRLYHEAQELKKRFNDSFWMEEEGFFAMALDPDKRQVKSIGSNAGHCLAAGIVHEDFVAQTAQRFVAEDLFTGWGIRTLSSQHPAYNPYSYHRGSVWPVEHGTFAVGFARYGLHDSLHLICNAQFNAASLFDFYRLPELFSGHQLDEDHPFPAMYPQANSPQAWSASTIFYFVQAMLGLYPYAPLKILLVDPYLPEWLPEITLHDLQVGNAKVSIRFFRKEKGKSDYEILQKRGTLHVFRQPSPWSLTATFAERLKDALTSLLPGK